MSKIKQFFNRVKNREDYALGFFEYDTVCLIRASHWKLRWFSTDNLYNLFHIWSTTNYCAGWMEVDDKGIKEFAQWCFSRPVDELLKTNLKPFKDTKYSFDSDWTKDLDNQELRLEDYYQVGKEKEHL